MDNKKGPFLIKELRVMPSGKQIWGKFLVLEKNDRRTRDGKAISNMRLGDATGEIDAVVWENCAVTGTVETGKVIGILGDTSIYNNRLQITARRIKGLDDEDPLPFIKSVDGIEQLKKAFMDYIESITDPYLKSLLDEIFTEEGKRTFFRAPAARKIHHAYAGGLLEHTLSVAALCLAACPNYPGLNRDLLLTGALLHDIGKVEELSMNAASEYTVQGRMLGHIYMGSEIASAAIEQVRRAKGNFPAELAVMLKHMILSHHGVLEFGSPVVPHYPEALLLHMMDNLDAKMFVFWNRIREDGENPDVFTPYDNMSGQHYYKYRYQHSLEDADEMPEEQMEENSEELY